MDRPGVPPPYRIDDAGRRPRARPGRDRAPANGIGFRDDPDVKVRNLAVPGEDIQSVFEGIRPQDVAEQLVTGSPDGRDILKFLILGLPLRDESVSQVSRARELRPSFLMVWLGNNDILEHGHEHGPERRRPAGAAVRPARTASSWTSSPDAGVDMAVATLPDVTAIAVLRRAAGEVTQCQRGDGTLEPVAAGRSHLDRPRPRAAADSALLQGARRPSSGRRHAPTWWRSTPRSPRRPPRCRRRAASTIAVVDIFGLFDQLASTGVDLDGNGTPDLTTRFLGGVFSLDGIHPTRTANALIANAFIDVLNTRFGEAIPPVDVAQGGAARTRG